ncbi:MAG: MBL fold metallo-hydrolase [Bacteroidota bacterium]|nr:MBL fold metallo-hydrolase [Bacteroidota bacterium]
MNYRIILTAALVLVLSPSRSQTTEKGPYTVSQLAPGVKHIEDANKSNPAGMHIDTDGKTTGMNNCSDMYLVQGKDKILLIDLSNFIKWDTSAISSLRSIVYSAKGNRDLFITVTHNHGDHLGMLPAFKDDPEARFWIPAEEFSGREVFPKDRTIAFPERASLDLGGGYVINSLELPGHTAHSTIYFLKDKNLVFTGDAIGSGNGVWLFSHDSFLSYRESIRKLIKYIQDPFNKIDPGKLVIYGGHYWQKGDRVKLTAQYVFDMQTLIEKIGEGKADEEKVSYNKYLDTNFKYGTATITWNKADELKYSGAK